MKTILLTAAALLAAWFGLAVLLGPPVGRMLKRSAAELTDAEVLADFGDDPADEAAALDDCPDWCPGSHAPGAHHRTVDVREKAADPGGVWVELNWYTGRGRPPGDPEVTLVSIVGTDETLMPMSPGEAGMLAASIAFPDADSTLAAWGRALAGDAGWLAQTLARAAVAAGYEPCAECGTPGARREYDRATGEQVARCAGCHHEALVGGELR